MPVDYEAPDQGDIFSKGLVGDSLEPEACCIQEYIGLQTFNSEAAGFVEAIAQHRAQLAEM